MVNFMEPNISMSETPLSHMGEESSPDEGLIAGARRSSRRRGAPTPSPEETTPE